MNDSIERAFPVVGEINSTELLYLDRSAVWKVLPSGIFPLMLSSLLFLLTQSKPLNGASFILEFILRTSMATDSHFGPYFGMSLKWH